MLQRARTLQGFADVHTDLLARFAARQDVAGERRTRTSTLQAEMRKLHRSCPSRRRGSESGRG